MIGITQLAEKGHSTLLDQLLALGMPIDSTDPLTQETILLRAAKAGQKDVVELCISKGADLTRTNVRTVERAKQELMKLILMIDMSHSRDWQTKKQSFLHLSFMHPSTQWQLDVKRMIQPSLMILADDDGRTPLHYACMNG